MPAARLAIPAVVAERAATRWVAEGSHWISTYSVASHGYAQIGWRDTDAGKTRVTTAHRASWVHHHGDPGADTIDHQPDRCNRRQCVNPEHLRRLSNLENARRTSGRDWALGLCLHGHGPEGWRPKGPTRKKGYCSPCRIEQQRRRRRWQQATSA